MPAPSLGRVVTGAVAVLGAGVAAADRAPAGLAAGRIAERIRNQQDLSRTPRVSFEGFSFLAQACRGRYRDVRIHIDSLRRGPVVLSEVRICLRGIRLPLRAAVCGDVEQVPVESVEATVLLRYADLNAALPPGRVEVSAEGGRLRLRGSVAVLRSRIGASAMGEVQVVGDSLLIVPHEVGLDVGATTLAVGPALVAALTYSIPHALPFGLRLRTVSVQPDGLLLRAGGEGLVLSPERRLAAIGNGP